MEYVRSERRKLSNMVENILFFGLAWAAVRSDMPVRRVRLRRRLLSLVVAHPEQLSGALILDVVRATGRQTAFTPALNAMTRYPIRDRLGEIACPTLIIWGEHDRLVPVGDATEFEWLIAGSRKPIYEDTGHLPLLERPARFNADVAAFLDESLRPAYHLSRVLARAGDDSPSTPPPSRPRARRRGPAPPPLSS